MRSTIFVISALLLTTIGCAATPTRAPSSLPTPPRPGPVGGAVTEAFDTALAAFARHDRAHDWHDAACESVASAFVSAAKLAEARGRVLREAHYDAGLAKQRLSAAVAAPRRERSSKSPPLRDCHARAPHWRSTSSPPAATSTPRSESSKV